MDKFLIARIVGTVTGWTLVCFAFGWFITRPPLHGADWETFRKEHRCERTVEMAPKRLWPRGEIRYGYLCDDGVTYWL